MAATLSAVALPTLSSRSITRKGASQKVAAARAVVKSQRSTKLVCKADAKQTIAAVSAATTSAFVAASPALAVVDERMNGDGTALALGVNDPVLGWVMLAVFTTVWAFYYAAGLEGDKADLDL